MLDFSHLSLHDAKKEEMESQVRMLELEQALNVERARLRELRKQHYHMAQLVANKTVSSCYNPAWATLKELSGTGSFVHKVA